MSKKKRIFLSGTLALSFLFGCHAAKSPNYAAIRAHAASAESQLSQVAYSQNQTLETVVSCSPVVGPAAEESGVSKAEIQGVDAKMGCTWVHADGIAEVGSSMSPAQALASAISDARRISLKKILGVEIRSRDLVFQQSGLKGQDSLIQSLVQTMRQGRILNEKVGQNGYVPSTSCPYCQYQAAVSDCVKPLAQKSDRSFNVRVGLSKQHLTNGESDQIQISVSTACFIYLYDQSPDGSISLIAPNDYVSNLQAEPSQTLLYPDPKNAQENGLELVAQIPSGQKISAETISVIASREPLPQELYQLQKGDDYFSLLKRLNASPYDWTDDAQPYFIYAR